MHTAASIQRYSAVLQPTQPSANSALRPGLGRSVGVSVAHAPKRHCNCNAAATWPAQAYCAASSLQPVGSVRPQQQRCKRQVQAQVFDKVKDLFSSQGSGGTAPGGDTAARAQWPQDKDEDDDGAEMVRIDPESTGGLGGTSEAVFGPLAVLLVGFMPQELDSFRAMMLEMEADMVKIVPCTRAMLKGSLLAAMETDFPQYEQPPLGQRRALFLSGMYGSEVTEVIAAYRDAGLPPCVFAALVPNNANRQVSELVEAVWRDHAAMMAKQQEQQQMEDSY